MIESDKKIIEMEERLFERFSEVVYKSHLSIKEVDSNLHASLLRRLDKQDEILDTLVTRTEELYNILTNSRTLIGAVKTISKWIVGVASLSAAVIYLKHLAEK